MDALSLRSIAEFSAGTLRQGDGSRIVNGISTDSRAVAPDELFLALRGEKFDGHQFVSKLAAVGGIGAVVESGAIIGGLPAHFTLIEVEDTLAAYQRIATQYRRTLPLKMVAVTGSNGKTSTKDITATLLASRYRVLKTTGNFNNHIGVPRTLLQASAKDEFAVLEIGMNHPGEIAPLAAMAAPDVAIITNVGTAHIEFMQTREAIAKEKGALAEALSPSGHLILPAEDEFAATLGNRTSAQKLTVGFTRGDIRAEQMRQELEGTHFTLVADGIPLPAYLPIAGKHMVLNSLLAVAAARVCGLEWEQCVASLAETTLTKGRLERKMVSGFHIVDDSYNANPDSVVAALETLAQLPTQGRRIAVLGKMGELGRDTERGHRRVGEAAVRERLDQVIAVGSEGEYIAQGMRENGTTKIEVVPSVTDAAAWLNTFARSEDLILLKGSRSAGMERVLTMLVSPKV